MRDSVKIQSFATTSRTRSSSDHLMMVVTSRRWNGQQMFRRIGTDRCGWQKPTSASLVLQNVVELVVATITWFQVIGREVLHYLFCLLFLCQLF
jgi:hypothetical protein